MFPGRSSLRTSLLPTAPIYRGEVGGGQAQATPVQVGCRERLRSASGDLPLQNLIPDSMCLDRG